MSEKQLETSRTKVEDLPKAEPVEQDLTEQDLKKVKGGYIEQELNIKEVWTDDGPPSKQAERP